MPYKNKEDRKYTNEYESKPEQKKKRAARNKARAQLMKEGLVKVGDNKDVDHRKPLSKGGSKERSNLRAVPASKNRSFKRKSNHKPA